MMSSKRRFATPLSILAAGGMISYGLLRGTTPGDWLSQFLYNMKWPFSAALVVVTLVGCLIIFDARREIKKVAFASADFEVFDFRIWTCVNLIGVMALLWLLVMAVPHPNFRKEIQYVTRTVTQRVPYPVYQPGVKIRVVYNSPSYAEAYKICTDSGGRGYDMAKRCHAQAMQASSPPGTFREIVRTITYKDPYEVLFNVCMDHAHDNYSSTISECRGFALRQPPSTKE